MTAYRDMKHEPCIDLDSWARAVVDAYKPRPGAVKQSSIVESINSVLKVRRPECLHCARGVARVRIERSEVDDTLRMVAWCHGYVQTRTIDGADYLFAADMEALAKRIMAPFFSRGDRTI